MSTELVYATTVLLHTIPMVDRRVGLSIPDNFSSAPVSKFFGPVEQIENSPYGKDKYLLGYLINKNIMTKLAVAWSIAKGKDLNLRGSCLDQLLLVTRDVDPRILSEAKGRINLRRRLVSNLNDAYFYDGPVAHDVDQIHAPGNIDLQLADNDDASLMQLRELFIIRLLNGIEPIHKEQPGRSRQWDKIYQEAWLRLSPQSQRVLTLQQISENQRMQILRYVFETELIGLPQTRKMKAGKDTTVSDVIRFLSLKPEDYIKFAIELESLSITTCNSVSDRRSPRRCFNIDALTGRLAIDPIDLGRSNLRQQLASQSVYLDIPYIPQLASISDEALRFYEEGIDRKDGFIMDGFAEIVIRSLRKLMTLRVDHYDAKSLRETRRLMAKMAEVWQQVPHDVRIVIKNMRELEVCDEFDSKKTRELIQELGIRQILLLSLEQYLTAESNSIDKDRMKKILE